MSTTIKKIATVLASFILILFVVFVFNQTVQIVESARAVNRGFGNGVLWGLVLTYGVVLGAPFVLWFRLPKRMPPPVAAEGAEYDQFMADFKRRLARNPRLRGIPLNSRIDIDAALQTLDKQADNTVGVGCLDGVSEYGGFAKRPAGCVGRAGRADPPRLANGSHLLPEIVIARFCAALCECCLDGLGCCRHGRP
jgi:hypothetical protein